MTELLTIPGLAEQLVNFVIPFQRVIVAFSGGVDSAVVAKAAHLALGENAIAVTSTSASVPENQLRWARQTAAEIGIRHESVQTSEVQRAEYQLNDAKRCFWCKQSLYQSLGEIVLQERARTILSGTNYDDLGDYRPGIAAGQQAGVQTPLADLRIGKQRVRELARFWGLSVWDLPAAPCLASRIAYGVPVTIERLKKIEAAEAWLRERGMSEFRVRLHEGELARIEVPHSFHSQFADPAFGGQLVSALNLLGFRYVTLDLAGFRSGNLNDLIQIQSANS